MGVAPRLGRKSERGVIAILAGLMLLFLAGLAVVMAEVGLQALQRFEMHDASEALALANGFQVLSNPAPYYGGLVAADPLFPANAGGQPSYTPALVPVPIADGPVPSPSAAGGSRTTVTSNSVQILSPSSSIAGYGGAAVVGGNARVVVNQYQVSKFIPIPARIVLVVDYSHSMDLPYKKNDSKSPTASKVMQEALNQVINAPNLQRRVNWGFVPFSSSIGAVVNPLDIKAKMDATNLAAQKAKLAAAFTQRTFGDGTDIASAIDQGIAMLQHPTDDVRFGKGVIIIITDGEPNAGKDYDGKTIQHSLAYDDRVALASQAAEAKALEAWAAGIETFTILINRESFYPRDEVITFMQKISGDITASNKGKAIASNAVIAQVTGDVSELLNSIPVSNHCLTQEPIVPPAGSWMSKPVNTDLIYSYWIPSGVHSYAERAVTRLFTNANMDPPPNADGTYPMDPTFYFDPITNLIEVNVNVCLDFLNHQTKPPRLRVRWGLPRLTKN